MILTLIVIFSTLFVVTHLGLSHGTIRENLVAKLGLWPFRGVYSVVSFLTLGPAAVIWWQNRHLGPVLWDLGPWVERGIALVLMLIAIELLVLMLGDPSPASMIPGNNEPRGILRVTRHPMNMGLAGFGLAHILANGAVGDIAFFGSFLVLGAVGPFHLDARLKRTRGETFVEFCRQTSVIPFVAIARGRTTFRADEISFPLFVIGIVIYIALVVYHGRLFGADIF
ncbi:MAG: NnrU family protein [Holophagae bacterium]|jgi:uncharacterized membrane protein